MKNNKVWTILLIAVLALQAAAEALTVAVVLQLDMLPGKYLVALIAAMVLLLALMGLFIFLPIKGKVGTARRITACVLALLIVLGCAFASGIAAATYKTVQTVTRPPVVTNPQDMYLIVRLDDPAQTMADTKGYTFAAIENYNTTFTEITISKIHKSHGESPEVISVEYYSLSTAMADDLLAGNIDVMIMNGTSIAVMLGEDHYNDFFDDARILEAIPSEEIQKQETETTVPPTTEPPAPDVTNTPFIVYVSGSDTRSSKLTVSRSDVNILAVVNPVSKQVLLLNTPRDYYVPNPAGDGALDKLTHCGIYGVECSVEALEGLYETEIQYYGQINFSGFEKLVDSVGGITIYSDQAFTARDTYIQKGENNLNGSQALDLARERYHVAGGDNGRGKNQMKIITALIDRVTTGTTVISNYSEILDSLGSMFKTDMDQEEISKLVKMQLTDMAKWNIQSFAVFGHGGSETTYSAPGSNAYVMHPDQGAVDYAKSLIQKVFDGEILTEEDVTYPE